MSIFCQKHLPTVFLHELSAKHDSNVLPHFPIVQGRGDRVASGFSHIAFICIMTMSGPMDPTKMDANPAYRMYDSQALFDSFAILN